MDKTKQIQVERRSILSLMNAIEDQTNKMFHELLPEIDMEFHEIAYNDLLRLKVIRVNLANYLDDLTMD